MIPNDGKPITKIVFVSVDRQPAKLPRGQRAAKQWACPGCGRAVGADTLIDFEHGWHLDDGGRWWVKGICPHCRRRIQFTKHGAMVLEVNVPGREMASGKRTIIRKKGEPR